MKYIRKEEGITRTEPACLRAKHRQACLRAKHRQATQEYNCMPIAL